MCKDCGCQEANEAASRGVHEHWIDGKLVRHSHDVHEQGHEHEHASLPSHRETLKSSRRIHLEESVLSKNDAIAKENRFWFQKHKIRVVNMISAPGSGKTALLEKTIALLDGKCAVLTGDQERSFDAERLEAKGAIVKQIHTLSSCHLDASMIQKEIGTFVRPDLKILIIENVGNLVCPAAFDLGEDEKIALLSTAEGEDKPSKYPRLFMDAKVVVLTKMDLVPYLDWSLEKCENYIRSVNPTARILRTSAKTGEGLDAWVNYLVTTSSKVA